MCVRRAAALYEVKLSSSPRVWTLCFSPAPFLGLQASAVDQRSAKKLEEVEYNNQATGAGWLVLHCTAINRGSGRPAQVDRCRLATVTCLLQREMEPVKPVSSLFATSFSLSAWKLFTNHSL